MLLWRNTRSNTNWQWPLMPVCWEVLTPIVETIKTDGIQISFLSIYTKLPKPCWCFFKPEVCKEEGLILMQKSEEIQPISTIFFTRILEGRTPLQEACWWLKK